MLINRSPSSFFRPSKGIRKGCPLSPFLFLLIENALSRLILHAKCSGSYTRINVSKIEELSHILFVDDVLMTREGSIENIKESEHILELYKKATWMQINV